MNQLKTNRVVTQISSEQRVIKQLIEALLFEGVINYQLQHGVFTFQLNNQDYKATGKIAGFARIRLHADKIFCKIGEQWHAPKIDELVKQLPTTASLQKKLRTELMQTITLCNWNQQNLPRLASRRDLPYTQLESAIDEGHPYHPCFKARTGFTAQDHHDYGPESRNPFQLHWLAVDRALLKHQLNSEDTQLFWLQELGENIYQQLQQRLTDAQATFEKYSLLPIHPWQWQNLQTQFSIPLATKEIIDLGSAGDHYQASISVRTLLNISQPKKANIKLPLNMVNTSSLRTIESHSICTAPILTNWLTEIVKSDQYLQQHITLLPEYAGIRMRTQTDESPHAWLHALDGQTGVIFRESLMNKHAPMNSVPFVALSIIEKDTLPFIDPWIQEYGCQAWLEQLIKTAVLPIWHLLVHHGIALEAHAQNLILQHQQGWPTHITLRDFHESLEYVPSFLKTPALTPDFLALEAVYQHAEPNQYYWMEDVEALRELVIDTLFVFNLSDLATLLEDHYQFNESDFWQHIYQAFVDYQQTGQTDEARIRKMDIHQPSVQTESLIKKKLSPTVASEFHHTVNNPLLRVSPIISPLHATKTRSLTC